MSDILLQPEKYHPARYFSPRRVYMYLVGFRQQLLLILQLKPNQYRSNSIKSIILRTKVLKCYEISND